MDTWIRNRKLAVYFLLLVLIMLFVVGLRLWEFPVSCFSSVKYQEPLAVEQTDCLYLAKWQNETDLSEHPNIEVRGKWQQKVISEFCHRHGMDDLTGTLPENRHAFFRHVLFNVRKMALFCFIPKVGCTTMKSSIFAAGGYFSSSLVNDTYKADRDRLERELEKAIRKGTFLNSSLTDENRRMMMYQFERYTMVRHPLERYVSAYRSKFSKPLLWKPQLSKLSFFEKMKHTVLRKCEPYLYQIWKEEKIDVTINFTCYIIWLAKYGAPGGDDHFMTLMDNCQPCRMHYHFYGNFKSFVNDGKQILSRFTSDLSSFTSEGYYAKGKETHELLPAYYSQLTPSLKKTLRWHIKLDLEFYHTLYPAGIQLTKDLLGLDVSNDSALFHHV